MAGQDLVLHPCSKPSIENVHAVWLGAGQIVLVGNLSDSAYFFLKRNHLSSLTVVISVLGRYCWQTNLSIPMLISVPGCSSRPSLARAFRTESWASRSAFQQDTFPFPERVPVLSTPVIARNAGSAAVFSGPRASAIGFKLYRSTLPVTNDVFKHISELCLIASTRTSVCSTVSSGIEGV